MTRCVEGTDYMIDYYGALGLKRDATEDEIKEVLKKERAEWHPDRMGQLPKELETRISERSEFLSKAEGALLGTHRLAYDIRLENFDPHFVTSDPKRIPMDPTRERFDLDYLFSGKELDPSKIYGHALTVSDYNEDRLKAVHELYQNDTSDDVLKRLYKEELGKKFLYFDAVEELAWARAGVHGKRTLQKNRGFLEKPSCYAGAVEDEVVLTKEEVIPASLMQRHLALESGVAPALLTSHGTAEEVKEIDLSARVPEEIREAAQKIFMSRTDLIQETSTKKQEVLEELIGLTECSYIVQGSLDSAYCNVFLHDSEQEPMVTGASRFRREDVVGRVLFGQDRYLGLTFEELKRIRINKPTLLVEHNKILGPNNIVMEMVHGALQHFDGKLT